MPNWCEGSLKVRGSYENLKRFCREAFSVYEPKMIDGDLEHVKNPDLFKIETDDEDCFFAEACDTAYIEGTRRNFIEPCYIEFYRDWDPESMTIAFPFKAAWGIQPEPYIELSKRYGVDIRLYGFERGMGFNQEIIIINGKLKKNDEITFEDYTWECVMPNLGG